MNARGGVWGELVLRPTSVCYSPLPYKVVLAFAVLASALEFLESNGV